MIKARSYGGYAWDNLHGLVMSGGGDSDDHDDLEPLAHVETTSDGVTFEQFPPLPAGIMQHCLVSLDNGGDLFVTGGHDGEVVCKIETGYNSSLGTRERLRRYVYYSRI